MIPQLDPRPVRALTSREVASITMRVLVSMLGQVQGGKEYGKGPVSSPEQLVLWAMEALRGAHSCLAASRDVASVLDVVRSQSLESGRILGPVLSVLNVDGVLVSSEVANEVVDWMLSDKGQLAIEKNIVALFVLNESHRAQITEIVKEKQEEGQKDDPQRKDSGRQRQP